MTKRTTTIRMLGMMAVLVMALVGCGDGSDNPTEPEEYQNNFPTVESIAINPNAAIFVDDLVTLSAVSSDPDDDTLRYTWAKTGGEFDPPEAVGESIQWTAPPTSGTVQVTVVGDDGNGGTSQKHLDLEVIGGDQSNITVDVVGGVYMTPTGDLTNLGYVDAGDAITLVWDGLSTINVNATQPTTSHYAPDGTNTDLGTAPEYGWAEELPQPDAARYSLVGRIDEGEWFGFTQSGNTFTAIAPARGKLFLSINEQQALLADNTGYWRMTFSNAH